MTSRRRRVGFRVAAVLFSLASFTFPTLGIVDLISGFAPEALPGQAKLLQASYGLLASIITVGFISQVREPELRPAGLQQVATTLLAIAAAGLLGFNLLAFFGVVLIGVFLGILVILHPDRGRLVVLPEPPLGRLPALLALVGTVPGTIYTWQMAANQRASLPPYEDFTLGLLGWTAAAACALSIMLCALLAAAGSRGWRIPAWSAGSVGLLFGLNSVRYPSLPGSLGAMGGVVTASWAVAFLVVVERRARNRG